MVGTAYEVLGEFLRDSGILYKPDVHNISASEFDKLIDQYADKLDKSSSTYLFRKNILDQLKQWNSQIEFYPPFWFAFMVQTILMNYHLHQLNWKCFMMI